jgi:hypothetical protein
MNLSLAQPTPTAMLTWHILVDILEPGQVAAWVAEFPECRVVADSQQQAIAALQVLFSQRMATIQVMPLQLSSENSENPWFKLGGILQGDVSFGEWSDRFWAEKQQNLENDEVLSVEESLRVM